MDKVAAEFIKPNDRLTSFERLELYNQMYWFRLFDAIRDDCPGLLATLGEEAFGRLAQAYLAKCPSQLVHAAQPVLPPGGLHPQSTRGSRPRGRRSRSRSPGSNGPRRSRSTASRGPVVDAALAGPDAAQRGFASGCSPT